MSKSKYQILTIIITAVILTVIAVILINRRYQTVIVSIPSFSHATAPVATTTTASTVPQSKISLVPRSLGEGGNLKSQILLPVPFTPQAPTGNWDELHNEACEEADAIMAAQYFVGNQSVTLPPQLVETEISKLTVWEDRTFGYHLDTTSAETAQMITAVYGLQTKLINNFTEDGIKNELSQNHLVIISEYGRALGNPNYKTPGPIHHMLLIRGYDGDNLITNDSGTRNGRSYIYTFDTIYQAAGDWDHTTNNVDSTKKIAISVWK